MDERFFWSQTPSSFEATMKGVRRKLKREFNERFSQAHTTALLGRTKKIEKIEHYIGRSETGTRKQTPEEMLAVFKGIASRGGIMKIRKVRRKRTE